MRLDHLSYACSAVELADVVQRIGRDLGGTFIDGGCHPTFGTRNFVLPLANDAYVEVVSALDHPAAQKAPFGQAVHQRAQAGGGWLSWVLSTDDLRPIEQLLGRSAAQGQRIRPDGLELRWKQIGVREVMDRPYVPYFVSWECDSADHPSAGGGEIAVASVEICGEQDELVALALRESNGSSVQVTWVNDERPGVTAVTFQTPSGLVRVD